MCATVHYLRYSWTYCWPSDHSLGIHVHWQQFWGHDDVIKWKHFPRYWPIVREILRSPVNSPHKGQWRGTLMFFLIISAWINDWVNNGEAGDLRRHRTHYDVTVMGYSNTGCIDTRAYRAAHVRSILCATTNPIPLTFDAELWIHRSLGVSPHGVKNCRVVFYLLLVWTYCWMNKQSSCQ